MIIRCSFYGFVIQLVKEKYSLQLGICNIFTCGGGGGALKYLFRIYGFNKNDGHKIKIEAAY